METNLIDRSITPLGDRADRQPAARVTEPSLDRQTDAVRLGEIGTILLNAGRYEDALGLFEQALALQPHDVESWCRRADALAALDRYEDALHSLEQAQELAGFGQPRLWVQKAVILILLNRPQEALSDCNYALWLEPEHAQAWLFRGVSLQRMGRYPEAYRSYRRASHPAKPTLHHHPQTLCHDLNVD
jgi:tetratricopeptide (TPR) repeat protein